VIVLLTDRFGELSETFVVSELRALRAAGAAVRVESVAHAVSRNDITEEWGIWKDEPASVRLGAMLRLAFRNPLGCLRDLVARRRWRPAEEVFPLRMLAPAALRLGVGDHLHVHFAATAALSAMRIARITGVPWSVTAHGWEIWQRPANLAEKLESARFATTGCEYNARHLRSLGGPVHVIVMGVDGETWKRSRPHPAERVVLAVGRLVEKKGFSDLAAAAASLDARVVIAGEGPLHSSLQGVELLGAVAHADVRALLEEAAVVCVPCVVAPDGDRDSMPVIAKEALAMEVPVVATDEVGLPEVVHPEWGALVPPHDPPALAAALTAELDRPPSERAARGAAGRAFVLEHCDVHTEARKLLELIARA
jgi:glycosyltransferase involved in cell wall biosynthesis